MKVKEVIAEFITTNLIISQDEDIFSDEDDIFELGFVNSLFAMTLLNYLEKEFSIVLEPEDMNISNFNTLINIESFVNNKLSNKLKN